MITSSFSFLLFVALSFIIYWALPAKGNKKTLFLLFTNSIFYLFFSWQFLLLLVISASLSYYIGKQIQQNEDNEKRRTIWFWSGIVIVLGNLLYFKYTNFFIQSFSDFLQIIGFNAHFHTLKILIPIGISYFTFKQLSYLIDIYQESYEVQKDTLLDYVTYITFFPTILSGPIDRPSDFLPQVRHQKKFDYHQVSLGVQQVIWGLFKKIVIADNCARYVDAVWSRSDYFSSATLAMAAVIYVIQLYADFSGYSDIAIGVGRLFGYKVTDNFKYPLFALNIADFWKRWHISLTSWVTDYIFTPLSFIWRRYKKWGIIGAIIIDFLIVGFWHGANWQYLVYGLFHGLLFIPLIFSNQLSQTKKIRTNRFGLPIMSDVIRILGTFILVAFSFILFRAPSLHDAIHYIRNIFSVSFFKLPYFLEEVDRWPLVVAIGLLLVVEIYWKKTHFLNLPFKSFSGRVCVYLFLALYMLLYAGPVAQSIYVQF